MIIDCLSDLHGYYPPLPGGDLLIIAGDLTRTGKSYQFKIFFEWLEQQKYEKKIVIAGNHDHKLQAVGKDKINSVFDTTATYLCDSGCEYRGLKIWGSPWTPKYGDWAFMYRDETLFDKWQCIPDDTDILITHGPPYQIMDRCFDGREVGSKTLRDRLNVIYPKLHIFGHIHESMGEYRRPNKEISDVLTLVLINCSHVDERYIPRDRFYRVIWREKDEVWKDSQPLETYRLPFEYADRDD